MFVVVCVCYANKFACFLHKNSRKLTAKWEIHCECNAMRSYCGVSMVTFISVEILGGTPTVIFDCA